MARHRGGAAVVFAIAVLFVAAVGGFILYLRAGTMREADVLIQGDSLVITGQYGVTYRLDDIQDVHASNALPSVGRKVNGAGLSGVRKGDYEVEGLGTARLFLHSSSGPYLYLKVNDKWTILSFPDGGKTTAILDRIRSAWDGGD